METIQSHDASPDSAIKAKAKAVVFSSRYTLLRRLAEGGTSVLYLARDKLSDNSLVALKCIHSSLLQYDATRAIARSEFAVAKQLAHPNLVSVFDIRRNKGIEYLVMEFISGDSLKDVLSRSNFSYERCMQVMKHLVSVLTYLHTRGVVHSDVKPSNIILGEDNSVKLIDLANCRQDSRNNSPKALISGEHFFGYSLDYSSPQVIKDEPATPSDDVFSLACVLYEMLEGRSPIPAEKKSASMSLSSVKKPRSINVFQWRVLKRAMSMSASKRYQSVEQFYREFTRARAIPVMSASLLAVSVCLFISISLIWGAFDRHQNDHLFYKNAYEQQQSFQSLLSSIRGQEPLMRYQQLGKLESLPEEVRQNALLLVQDDVISPVVAHIQKTLFASSDQPDFTRLNKLLASLFIFYPASSDLLSARETVINEQKMLVNGLILSAQELIASGLYNAESSVGFNNVIDSLIGLGVGNFEEFIDTDTYAESLEAALSAENWLLAGNLYQFAAQTKNNTPMFFSLWSDIDPVLMEHLQLFSNYIVAKDYSLNAFPAKSGMYFFADDLNRLQASIKRSFYNKDIKNYAKELLGIQAQYNIPDQFEPFKQVNRVLRNKIKDKIRFHNSKFQYKSAKSLSDLASRLPN